MKNKLYVLKFGGTSVSDLKKIKRVADIICDYHKRKIKLVVVVSAMGETTDKLIKRAKRINSHPSKREMDMLVSTGEQISGALLAMALHRRKKEAISFTGSQVGIITDTYHTKAKILKIETKRIKKEINSGRIVIVSGFQGISTSSEITTLGRGGSDLTAVALAVSLKAHMCEIYTDVDGIYTADPNIVPEAKKLTFITFDEMLELASRGAQVMQTRAIEVAKKFNMPIVVKSSFSKKGGTVIKDKVGNIEEAVVRGVTLAQSEAKITICDVPDTPGIAARIFNALSLKKLNIDMIVQNVSRKKTTDISFTISKSFLDEAIGTIKKFVKTIGAGDVIADRQIAKVSVVGVGMKSHSGVAAECFSSLAKNKINIEMISTSEISISCVVKKHMGKKALNVLHKAFNLDKI